MRQSYKNLVSDTAVFAVGNMLTKAIQFFLLPMYTALLSAEQYGIGELVNNLSELLYPLCCIGIYEGVFRFSLDRDADRKEVFSTGALVALSLIPVVIAAGVFGFSFTGFDYTWYLVVLCLASSLKMLCLQFAKGIGKTILYAASGIAGALILCGAGFLLLGVWGMGVVGYLLALILAQFVQLLITACGSRIWRYFSFASISREMTGKLVGYSLPMIPNALAWWFVNLSGRYIVLLSQGAAAAGLYTAASKLPSIMVMLVTIFQQAWQIFSAREFSSNDRSESFAMVFRVYTACLLCSGSLVIAISEPLSRLMLSGEFYEAWVLVPPLMLGAVINGYSTYFGTLYNAAKRNGMIFVTTILGATLNIVMGIVLSFSVGVWGPVIGSVVAYSTISLTRAIDTKKFVSFRCDLRYQGIGIAVLAIEAVALAANLPLATPFAMLCFAFLLVFSVVRNRSIVAKVISMIGRKA